MKEIEELPVAPERWDEGNAVQPGHTNFVKQEIDGEPMNLELDGAPVATSRHSELQGDTTVKSP